MARAIDKDKLITSMAWHDQQGMISCIDDILDIIEAFPTLTPPNEPLTLEELRMMVDPTPVWWDWAQGWVLAKNGMIMSWNGRYHNSGGLRGDFYRRPPEGEEALKDGSTTD